MTRICEIFKRGPKQELPGALAPMTPEASIDPKVFVVPPLQPLQPSQEAQEGDSALRIYPLVGSSRGLPSNGKEVPTDPDPDIIIFPQF